jgi:putative membrane protein
VQDTSILDAVNFDVARQSDRGDEGRKITDYLANERTYLAWLRTGIAIIALGFVVAKFALIVKELVPSAPTTSFNFSSYIGIALVLIGAAMEILALKRFMRNQDRIKQGEYEPSATIEWMISSTVFVTALLLAVYLVYTV